MQEVRIDELLLDAREHVLRAHKEYKVDLIFAQEAEDDALITVHGNEYLLRTACINLMENNCKFSDNHTSCVQISFWKNQTILRFSDAGIGIPESDLENLFTPFYRGTNRDYASGSGIGMALVYKIVHLHKGDIEVISRQGEGTVFTVRLPHI